MDFSVIFQLRTKKFWWMDVIFYFVVSLLIATIFCYFIFLIKDSFQREDIKKEEAALQTVGTYQQKEYEKYVIDYKNKINDFSELFESHEFASNIFAFVQAQTMQNIWFKQFSLDKKNNTVQLSGESEDMDTFSRQIDIFENENNKKYVKSIGTLNSLLGESTRVEFNIDLALDKNIFSYLSSLPSAVEVVPPPEEPPVIIDGQEVPQTKSSEKLITSFHLLLDPEIIGLVDIANYNVVLNVPYGTDVKNLTPTIIVSSGATVSPDSHILQDFTSPVTYIVTAEDGSVQNYKVTVNVLPEIVEKTSQSKLGIWIIIIIVVVIIIAVIVGAALFFWKKRKNQKVNI